MDAVLYVHDHAGRRRCRRGSPRRQRDVVRAAGYARIFRIRRRNAAGGSGAVGRSTAAILAGSGRAATDSRPVRLVRDPAGSSPSSRVRPAVHQLRCFAISANVESNDKTSRPPTSGRDVFVLSLRGGVNRRSNPSPRDCFVDCGLLAMTMNGTLCYNKMTPHTN